MIFRVLADATVVVHIGFVVFVVFGGLLVLFRAKWAIAHVPAVVWGASTELGGWLCPLTPMENWLRRRAGDAGYEGGFIEEYVLGCLYPGGMTRRFQVILGLAALAWNVLIYAAAVYRFRNVRRGF